MPAKSDAQRKWACAVAASRSSAPGGMSKSDAGDFCHTPGKLPEKVSNKEEKSDQPDPKEEVAEKKPAKKKKSGWKDEFGRDSEYV